MNSNSVGRKAGAACKSQLAVLLGMFTLTLMLELNRFLFSLPQYPTRVYVHLAKCCGHHYQGRTFQSQKSYRHQVKKLGITLIIKSCRKKGSVGSKHSHQIAHQLTFDSTKQKEVYDRHASKHLS